MRGAYLILIAVTLVAGAAGFFALAMKDKEVEPPVTEGEVSPIGSEIARYKNVPAYQNGKVITTSHGKHYAKDGYYYGQKWQCVEYVKRFYHDAHGHHMPSVWGHACDFFDPEVTDGEMNPARGMRQYRNGGSIAPKPDDLLVFRKGSLGHVAIVTKVTDDKIEVIQQNVHGASTSQHTLVCRAGKYTVGENHQPAGWLRLPHRLPLGIVSACVKPPIGYSLAMPRKLKALIKDLKKAGFSQVAGGKGSHRKFVHGKVDGFALISGKEGEDAKPYQEKHVKEKISESQT